MSQFSIKEVVVAYPNFLPIMALVCLQFKATKIGVEFGLSILVSQGPIFGGTLESKRRSPKVEFHTPFEGCFFHPYFCCTELKAHKGYNGKKDGLCYCFQS